MRTRIVLLAVWLLHPAPNAWAGSLALAELRPHRAGKARAHAFLKRRPYIVRP